MKTIDAINAFQTLQRLLDDPSSKSVKLSYALLKNRRNLEPIVQAYNQRLTDHKDLVLDELLREWRDIASEYAELSSDNKPILDQSGAIKIKNNRVIDYNLACEEIMIERVDYQEAFHARNNLIAQLQATEVDAMIYPIALSLFPPETDLNTLEMLFTFIDGDR